VKAGGKTRSDLFTDSTYLLDPELLDNLASLKLSKSLRKIENEGWAWVVIDPDLSWEKRNRFGRVYEQAILTPEQSAERDALEKELNTAYATSSDDEALDERIAQIEARMSDLDKTNYGFRPEHVVIAGAIITIDRNGKVEIERGMVKPEDKPRLKALEQAKESGNPEALQAVLDAPTAPTEKGMSASLIEELTKHRTAALSATMATNPEIALAATVHAMAFPVFYRRTGQTATNVSAEWGNRRYHPDGSLANDELDREESLWRDRIPGDETQFWQWCMEADQIILLALLAFCAAISIDAVRRKQDRADNVRLANADLLASALQLDMTYYFRPDADNYFGKINRDMILADLKEITGAEPSPAQLKMKKGELAKLSGKLVDGTGWLPAILRSPDNSAADAKPKAARKKCAA
jgi:ParB family transcriptional regulator, chromosome partitioning protein